MSNPTQSKQFLRDNETGQFLGMNGEWTSDERHALDLQSMSRIIHARLRYPDRELALVLKTANQPDQFIGL